MPRATTAACDVLPPRLVRMPRAATMPRRSSGLVSRRTRITSSPRSAHSTAAAESKTTLPTAAPGRGVHALRDQLPLGVRVEAREHQLRELGAVDPLDRLVHVDEALVDELAGDPERRLRGPLADPRLQHPQLAVLDGELDVAQVAVVLLERLHDAEQLVVRRLVDLLEVGQRDRVADAGHDVLALGVLQVVAVDALRARGGVAGERHARAGVLAAVAEDHRDDAHRGAEVAGDPLLAAVEHGSLGVPRVEDRADRQVQLVARVLRERRAGALLDQVLVRRDELLQVLDAEVHVVGGTARLLEPVELVVEGGRLDAEDGGAEHLQQPSVGVVGEPLVAAGQGREAVHRLVVEADVEDRLHHPGHRELRARADRDQQRPVGLAEGAADLPLERGEVLAHLVGEAVGQVAVLEVGPARVGADDEPRRDRQPQVRHLREVRALAAQQVPLVPAALGEVVDVLGRLSLPLVAHGLIMTRLGPRQQGPPALGRAGSGGQSSVTPAHRLTPASTASSSMALSSSSVSGGPARASRLVSSCSTDEAPMTAEVTRGSRSAHCSASWASFWPRPSAISLSRRTCRRVASSRCALADGAVLARGPRVLRDAVQVAVGEQPLGQRGEHDAAHALLLELVEQALLDPAVEHGVRRLVDQQRRAQLAGDRGRLLGPVRGVRRDAGVERTTGADRRVERHHRLLDRASRGRSGGCRRCRRSPAPSGPATGRARRGRTSATRRPGRRDPATCRSRPWSRSPARRGGRRSPRGGSGRSSPRRGRRAARSCSRGRSG